MMTAPFIDAIPGHATEPAGGAAWGKVILLGEHAVVYGRTAVAAAIDRQVSVRLRPRPGSARVALPEDAPRPLLSLPGGIESDPRLVRALARAAELFRVPLDDLEIEISSDLPPRVGLGSSAALSVSLVRALATWTGSSLEDDAVCAHSFDVERIFHGFPSGIDNTVATYGGLVAFRRGHETRRITAPRPLPLVIALSLAARDTGTVVSSLRQRWTAAPDRYEALFDIIDHIAASGERAISAGDVETLGSLMFHNHAVLRRLGVSTGELDELVELARRNGALGAKLTGGGGGGAVICLCERGRSELIAAFSKGGWTAFPADVGAVARAGRRRSTTGTHGDLHGHLRAKS
jgi:hydroxymethylglutaryl-CoA reductase